MLSMGMVNCKHHPRQVTGGQAACIIIQGAHPLLFPEAKDFYRKASVAARVRSQEMLQTGLAPVRERWSEDCHLF